MSHIGAPIPWNGSKRWIADDLREVFRGIPRSGRFFDPFCGSASASHLFTMEHPEARVILGDANPWLTDYMEALRTGGAVADPMSLEYLKYLRTKKDGERDATVEFGAIRFAACLITSWGNRWLCRPDGSFYGPFVPEVKDPAWMDARLKTMLTPRPWMTKHIQEVRWGVWTDTVRDAGEGDVVYLDPPYPETLGYGNQPWTVGDLLDLVDWVAETLKRDRPPAIVVSNVAQVARLFTRLGMDHRLITLREGSRTRRARVEVLAWSGAEVETGNVTDLFG